MAFGISGREGDEAAPGAAAQPPTPEAARTPAPGAAGTIREEVVGKGPGETAGGSPECGHVPRDDADLAFDPASFPPQDVPSISSCGSLQSGGEDYLSVNFYVNHLAFEDLARRLDDAQSAAAAGRVGDDVLSFGGVKFLVADRGARQGSGKNAVIMRWRLQSEHGLVMLLLNRPTAHDTLPNVQVRATSTPLMRLGFDRTWELMQQYVSSLNASIVRNSLSRVDACADFANLPIDALAAPFDARWFVARSGKRRRYAEGWILNSFMEGEETCGFSVAKTPLMLRVYEKRRQVARDMVKLALLKAHRWGCDVSCATRVEFEIHRTKLKQLGVGTVEDWIEKRADILEYLTHDWFRLTDGPVDRKHPERSTMHPTWALVREAMSKWTGAPMQSSLAPLPKLWVDTSRLHAMAVGILKGSFARVGKVIEDNEQFFREVEFAIRDAVGERDMAAEVSRRALELGASLVSPSAGDFDDW